MERSPEEYAYGDPQPAADAAAALAPLPADATERPMADQPDTPRPEAHAPTAAEPATWSVPAAKSSYAGSSAAPASPYGANPYEASPYTPTAPSGPAPTYGPPAAAGPYTSPMMSPAQPASGLALASMITGIAAIVGGWSCALPILAAPVAIVLAVIGMRETAHGAKSGRGFAITGLVLGIIGTFIMIAGVIVLVAMIATGSF